MYPDFEVISFSQPRSTPASDSLKTAETVAVASRLINVETSNHSPSVTVSIFDALAEILTSTPKPVISISTTPKPINLELNIPTNNNIGVSTTETYSSSTNDLSERENSSEFTLNVQTESQISQVTTTKPVQTSTIADVATISTASTTEMSSTTSLPLETNAPLPLSTPVPQIFTNDALSTIETPTHALASTTTFAPYTTTHVSMRRPFATLVLYSTTSEPTISTEAVYTVTPHDFQSEPFASYDDTSSATPNTDDNTSDMLQFNITPDTYNNYVDESSTSYAQNDFATVSTFNSLFSEATDISVPEKSSELILSTLITSTTPISLSTTTTNIDSSSEVVTQKINTENYSHSNFNLVTDTLTMNSTTVMSPTTLPSTSAPFNVNNEQLTKEIEFISSKIHNVLNASSNLSSLSRRAKLLQDIETILLENNIEALQKVMGIGPVALNQPLSFTDSTNMSDTTDSNNENSSENSLITNIEQDDKSNDILNIHENLNNMDVEYSTMSASNFGFTEYENVVTSDISIGSISSTSTDDSYISTSTYNPITESSTNTAEVSTTSDVLSSSLHSTQNLSQTTPSTFKNILQTSPNYPWIPPFPTAWRNKPNNENFQSSENPMSRMTSNPIEVQSSTTGRPKKDYYIYGVLPNNTVVRKNPNDNQLEILTEASPFIIFGVLPNNTIIRKFPNGTHVPTVTQHIDVLPIDPKSLRNPQSPVYRNPESVKPINIDIVSSNEITQNNKIQNTERLQITAPNIQTMTDPVYNTMMTV